MIRQHVLHKLEGAIVHASSSKVCRHRGIHSCAHTHSRHHCLRHLVFFFCRTSRTVLFQCGVHRFWNILARPLRLLLLHEPGQLLNSTQLIELFQLLFDLPHLRVLLAKPRILIFQVLLEALELHLEI